MVKIISVIILLSLPLQAQIMTSGNYAITSDTFDCSAIYVSSGGGDYQVANSVGQASPMKNCSYSNGSTNLVLQSGYLPLPTIVQSDPPSVQNVVITGDSGDITIKYDLADIDSALCSISVGYRGGRRGSSWSVATTTGTINNLTPGSNMTIIWNSVDNESGISASDYQIRIIPQDEVNTGAAGMSSLFPVDNKMALKDSVILKDNLINPMAGECVKIKFNIQKSGEISLKVYDIRGVITRTFLKKENLNAGDYEYNWCGKGDTGNIVGSGMYYLHIKAVNWKMTKQIAVVK